MNHRVSLFALNCLICVLPAVARPGMYRCASVCNERQLYSQLRKHKAAVILLYDGSSKQHSDTMRRLKQAFDQLAKSSFYPRRAVLFVSLDITLPVTKLFMRDNGIKDVRVPLIILFSDGVLLKDQHGMVTFNGDPTREQLKEFIDSYIMIDIAHYVQEERAFKQYQDIIRDRAHVYYTPYFSKVANPWNDYWGWPYYGMAQGNYGGNIGVNFFASNY